MKALLRRVFKTIRIHSKEIRILEMTKFCLHIFGNSSQPHHDIEKERTGMHEIVNGSSVLPELMFEKLQAHSNFRYLDQTRVTGLNQTNKKVSPSKVWSDRNLYLFLNRMV